MSSYHLDDEVFGDGSFSVSYGRGFGGDGNRMYHFVLDVVEDKDTYHDWAVISMTPEDAVRLATWLVTWAKVVKNMETDSGDEEAESNEREGLSEG